MNYSPLDLRQKDILIVDDTPDNLRVLSSLLIDRGCKVRKARSGRMALTICQNNCPDAILLDIMMPDIDGYEVCRQLKSNEKTSQIPVIFMSALNEPLDKVKAFSYGGVDYITKPFQLEEVLARLTHHLTIRDLTEELQRSNADLEQFARIVSHDLQSPLQAILGFADLLQWKYQNSEDSKAQCYVNHIIEASLRMQNLIQELLAYSRIGREEQQFEPLDFNDLLEEVCANLYSEISTTGARVCYVNLPTAIGDRTQLLQLFQNLIGNAIKFRSPGISPEIKISAIQKNQGEWQFKIEDNGIGIAPHNFNKVFEVFQRVHSSKEYPGHGIGLTICKKIVERHQGRIWVESESGVGTSFYFTLSSD